MSEFVKYMHLERFGTAEVDGIEFGETYVFPKLDGTNAQVWLNSDGTIGCGSRNRVLEISADNAGFMNWAVEQESLKSYLSENPSHTLYGEWLVPHSLKTYRDDAWRNFYVFDVMADGSLVHYNDYKDGLDKYGVEYLAPISVVKNGNEEKYQRCLDKNTHLIKDGEGVGEGVVIKNYEFKNKYGRVVWAKIVTNSFKEKHIKEMGAHIMHQQTVEEKICDEFVTKHLVDKVQAKIALGQEGWSSRYIGQLIGVVWHDLITEEIWEILKSHKNPKIDFKTLQRTCTAKIKELRPDLF